MKPSRVKIKNSNVKIIVAQSIHRKQLLSKNITFIYEFSSHKIEAILFFSAIVGLCRGHMKIVNHGDCEICWGIGVKNIKNYSSS